MNKKVAVCPWTKKMTITHELGRRIAVRGRLGARVLLPIERAVNGVFKPDESPAWMEEPDRGWLESFRNTEKPRP